MGVPTDKSSVYGAVESVYGTDPASGFALCLTGPPSLEHNDEFNALEKLSESGAVDPGTRKHIDLGIGLQSHMTNLTTALPVRGSHHPLMIAMGLGSTLVGVGASGTTMTYQPLAAGLGSSTFITNDLDTLIVNNRSETVHLGTRGDGVLTFDPSNGYVFVDLNGRSLHSFNQPYAVGVGPVALDAPAIPIDASAACFDFTINGNPVEIQSLKVTIPSEVQALDIKLTDCGGSSAIDSKPGTPTFELVFSANPALIDNTVTLDWIRQAHDNEVDWVGVLSSTAAFQGQTINLTMGKMRPQELTLGDGPNDLKVWTVTGLLQEVTPGTADYFVLTQTIV